MAQIWDDILQEGSYGGVKFDFVSVKDSGSNDLDELKMPGKQGGRILPKGRNSGRWNIMAVVVDDDYPKLMFDLVNQLDDGGAPKEFVHPIFGSRQAACATFEVVHDAEDSRDSCMITISLVEHQEEDFDLVARKDTTPARANAVRSLITQALEALSKFSATLDAATTNDTVIAVQGAINAADGVAAQLEATGDELSNAAIGAFANGALAKADAAAVTLADYSTTEQYDLAAAILAIGTAIRELAQGLLEQRPPLSTHAVAADTNLLALAHDLGADAEELLALNSFPDPSLIPAGFKLVHYAA